MKEITYNSQDKCFTFECPHCDCVVQVEENLVNCQIFRHGIIKQTQQQMNPHTPKNICDRFSELGLIDGCGKPFRMFMKDGKWSFVDVCDYI